MNFSDRLHAAVERTESVVCVGLDPRQNSLPAVLRPRDDLSPQSWADAYRAFCRGVIDAVAGKVPVVKPQSAFFEALGPPGVAALADVIAYARSKGLLTIVDAKRGDIGSTAEAYAAAYLGADSPFGGDSLTVSPYLGDDSMDPFIARGSDVDGGIFVLVKTSNPGGGTFQNLIDDGRPIYQHVADHLTKINRSHLGRCGYGIAGAVVGATYPSELEELRDRLANAWLLIPGFGAQGGAAEDVRPGFDSNGSGAVVNSSRNIIFAHAREPYRERFGDADWQRAVESATDEMNSQLNAVRN